MHMTDNGGGNGNNFGSCCEDLGNVIEGAEFEPLITVGDDGVLYMSVGLVEADNDETGIVDHPLFFCPFCGSKVQTAEDVKAKVQDEDK
jgi:hypothetical protein